MTQALLVTSSFLPGRGGIETYLAELAADLKPRLTVMAPAQREGRSIPDNLGYPTIGYRGHMLYPRRTIAEEVARQAGSLGTDKVLFGTPWPLGLLGPDLARRGLRYAAIVHGAELLVPASMPLIKKRLARALAGAELLFAVSDFTGGNLADIIESAGLQAPPIERMPARVDTARFHPGVDTTALRARLRLDERDKVVLFFGRLVRRKGVDRLVRAIDGLRKRGLRAVGVVAGTGPDERRVKRLVSRSGVPVLFAGSVPNDEAPAYYALADVFALPVADRWFGVDVEGLGVVLLEAAACETPVVVGRSGGTPEALIDGETGFVVDGADIEALVDRIRFLLENPLDAGRMGRAGRGYVEAEFSHRVPPKALLEWLSR